MSDNLVPFWEKSYQEYDTITFSNKPNSTIVEFEHLIGNPSKVLDVGCGEGQNAIYLARKGHHVDAFDLSEHGIAKLKHKCELSNVQVNAFAADLTTYLLFWQQFCLTRANVSAHLDVHLQTHTI